GERVGPLEVERVLGGHYEEVGRERARLAVQADLALLHRLEQGALRLGRGPVDLVGEQERGEDGAGPKVKARRRWIEDVAAEHVRRHQVGGELDASEGEPDDLGE